jgi:hypothetical protein
MVDAVEGGLAAAGIAYQVLPGLGGGHIPMVGKVGSKGSEPHLRPPTEPYHALTTPTILMIPAEPHQPP